MQNQNTKLKIKIGLYKVVCTFVLYIQLARPGLGSWFQVRRLQALAPTAARGGPGRSVTRTQRFKYSDSDAAAAAVIAPSLRTSAAARRGRRERPGRRDPKLRQMIPD